MNEEQESRVLTHVAERLDEWARWQRAEKHHRLGYPSAASFTRKVERMGEAGDPDVPRAREVERAMCRLAKLQPTLYRVLVAFYAAEQNATQCATQLGINRREVYRLKDRAEQFIAGALLAGDAA